MTHEKIITRHISPYHAVQGTKAEIEPHIATIAAKKTWKPIDTAPNDTALLVAYDRGYIRAITASENDYLWARYEGPIRGVDMPTHWMLQSDLLALIGERPEVSP